MIPTKPNGLSRPPAALATLGHVMAAGGLPRLEAQALAAHALGVSRLQVITDAGRMLTPVEADRVERLQSRRRAGEPLAYLIGEREFFSLDYMVTPAVLIPRPESELLVELALEHCVPDAASNILELGTGSGCIAISIAKHRPGARVVAVDVSAAALAVAQANAQKHATANLELLASDWFSALTGRKFDLILSNPPYIAAGDPHLARGDLLYEPQSALVGGADGLTCIDLIVQLAPQYLAADGWLAFEHGYDQAPNCRGLLQRAGYREVFTRRDLAGIERVSGGRTPVRS